MNSFNIKSKLYVQANKKGKVFYIIANIAIIILAVNGLVILFNEKKIIHAIGYILVAVVLSVLIRINNKNKVNYVFSIANVELKDSDINIHYENIKTIVFKRNEIEKVEYSDKLECVRIVGTYNVYDNKKEEVVNHKSEEWLLYVTHEDSTAFLNCFENWLAQRINYVDRN